MVGSISLFVLRALDGAFFFLSRMVGVFLFLFFYRGGLSIVPAIRTRVPIFFGPRQNHTKNSLLLRKNIQWLVSDEKLQWLI